MEKLIRSDYKEIHPIDVITFERVMKDPKFYNLYHINNPNFIPKRYNQGICPISKLHFYELNVSELEVLNFYNCYNSRTSNSETFESEGDFIFDFSSKGILNYKKCSCDRFLFISLNDIGDSSKCKCCHMKINMECSGCLYQYLYRKTTYEFFIERNFSFIIREYEKNHQFRNLERNFKSYENSIREYENITLEDKEMIFFIYLRNDVIRYSLLYLWSVLSVRQSIRYNTYEKVFNNLIWFMAHKIYLYKLECNSIKACPCIHKIHSYEKYIPFEPNEPLYKMIVETSDIIDVIQNSKKEFANIKSKRKSLEIDNTFDDDLFFNS